MLSAPPRMTAAELTSYLDHEFPQINRDGRRFIIEDTGPHSARLRMLYDERLLRPGGTISGPAMFELADLAMYAAVLAAIGPVPLAVTINLNINFMRKPARCDMIADCRLLKLGKALAVGEVALRSDGEEELAAHATATYSIPRKRQ